MEFLLVSDIHAEEYNLFASVDSKTGMNTRLYWSVHIFEQIREYGEKNGIKRLLIGGDIFDKRGTISVKVYDAVFQKLKMLSDSGWEIVSIVGNHDQAIRSGQIHALSPMPMLVVNECGIVELSDGCNVGCISFCETPNEFLKKLLILKNTGSIDCYLIHQGINGALIAGDEILSKNELNFSDVRDIIGEDTWVFSGHYHVHQKIDTKSMYIGSATPKDFGDVTPKGFLHFKSGSIKFIESEAPKFVVIKDNEIESRLEEIKDNYVNIEYDNKEPENLKSLGARGFVTSKKKSDRQYTRRSSIEPEHSPLSIIKAYVQDLRKSGLKNLVAEDEKLFEILNKIIGTKTIESSTSGKQVEFLKISINNFLSCKNISLDFVDYNGLVSIEGINLDDPSASSNGSGKSLIPEALKWCLFGDTARGLSGDQVIHRLFSSDCFVELIFTIDNDNYRLVRYRKHREFKNAIFFEMNNKEGKIDLRGKSDSDTQNQITKILGFEESTFDNTVFFGHNMIKPFAALSDKEQKQILENILGVEYFVELLDNARTLSKESQDIIKQSQIKLSYDKTRFKELEEELERLLTSAELFEETREQKIQEKETIISNKQEELNCSDSEIQNLDRIRVINNRLEDLYGSLEKIINIKETLKQLRSEFGVKNDQYRDLELKQKKILLEKSSVDSNIQKQKIEIENAKRSLNSNSCPICLQRLQSKDEINNFISTKEVLIEDYNKLGIELHKSFLELQTREHELSTELKQDAEEIRKFEAEEISLQEIEREIQSLDFESKTLTSNVEITKNTRKNAITFIENLRTQIQELQKQENPYFKEIEIKQSKFEETKSQIINNENLIILETENFEIIKFWECAFSDKGTPEQSPIKSYLFDAIIPVLDDLTRMYSSILTEGCIDVQFNTVTALKSGELRDKFSISAINRYGSDLYLGDSGGERKKIDLIVMFALHSLARIRSGSQSNLLFLDEVLDFLDEEGCQRVMNLLNQMCSEIPTIFVITHNENLKTRFACRLLVKKENFISSLVI